MLTITILLLAIGAVLAALGTLGFITVIHQPGSGDDLTSLRKAATIGRWLAIPGLCLYAGHFGASGAGLYALLLVAALVPVSLITKTTSRAVPAG